MKPFLILSFALLSLPAFAKINPKSIDRDLLANQMDVANSAIGAFAAGEISRAEVNSALIKAMKTAGQDWRRILKLSDAEVKGLKQIEVAGDEYIVGFFSNGQHVAFPAPINSADGNKLQVLYDKYNFRYDNFVPTGATVRSLDSFTAGP